MRTPQVRSERNPYSTMFEDFDRLFDGVFSPSATMARFEQTGPSGFFSKLIGKNDGSKVQ